ncbi:unnamed protein product [Rotaria sp. Silwood2]|nr:unnamed protein product [Rotaria sp. Silwood2]
METDSLPTSRPINVESTNPADIFLMFDAITYHKDAVLIRMINMFLGDQIFQQGIRSYLKKFSYNSATQHDLWQYLTQATNNTIDVEHIMTGWTDQAAYPVVDVKRTYTKTDQQQLYDWILPNPNYFGIYRTKYSSGNFHLIITQLQTNHTHIPTISRSAVIDDTFALSHILLVNATEAYRLIGYLKNERDLVLWITALSSMNRQEYLLGDNEIFSEVQQYFLELILPLYNSIGWTSINQSIDWRQALLQPKVLSAVFSYGYPECIDTARSFFRQRYLNPVQNLIPNSLRRVIYCIVVREGSEEEFQFLWNRSKNELVPSEMVNLLDGLACTKDRSRIV